MELLILKIKRLLEDMMEGIFIYVRKLFHIIYYIILALIKNITQRYELLENSTNFFNKLNNIYNGTKNKNGSFLLRKSSSLRGDEMRKFNLHKKTLPAIYKHPNSK